MLTGQQEKALEYIAQLEKRHSEKETLFSPSTPVSRMKAVSKEVAAPPFSLNSEAKDSEELEGDFGDEDGNPDRMVEELVSIPKDTDAELQAWKSYARSLEQRFVAAQEVHRALLTVIGPTVIPNPVTGEHIGIVPKSGAIEFEMKRAPDATNGDILLTLRRKPINMVDIKKVPEFGPQAHSLFFKFI